MGREPVSKDEEMASGWREDVFQDSRAWPAAFCSFSVSDDHDFGLLLLRWLSVSGPDSCNLPSPRNGRATANIHQTTISFGGTFLLAKMGVDVFTVQRPPANPTPLSEDLPKRWQ